jgi:hypothetical protein
VDGSGNPSSMKRSRRPRPLFQKVQVTGDPLRKQWVRSCPHQCKAAEEVVRRDRGHECVSRSELRDRRGDL